MQTLSLLSRFVSTFFINRKLLHTAFFRIFLLGFVFCACGKDNIETPEPIKKIIAEYTNCECDPFIDQYKWRGNIIYLQSCGGPACDCFTLFYNAEGKEFKMSASYTPDNFRNEGHFLKHVWKCR